MAFVRAARKKMKSRLEPSANSSADGKTLAISNIEGTFNAISNTCLHRGGPLGQGKLEGKIVTCPWHGWQYDATTGKVAANPAVGVATFPAEVRGEDIWVDIG